MTPVAAALAALAVAVPPAPPPPPATPPLACPAGTSRKGARSWPATREGKPGSPRFPPAVS